MCKKAKVTVKRAAEILGKSQQFVRIGLQRNILHLEQLCRCQVKQLIPITYRLKKLCDYAGIKEEDL